MVIMMVVVRGAGVDLERDQLVKVSNGGCGG